jgi:RNA polymerase sigma-70 factor (ECF subfamily)
MLPAAGEIAALVEPHVSALRRYAWALLQNDHAADELVADTLRRAVARWYLRPRHGDLRVWLFKLEHTLFACRVRRWLSGGTHARTVALAGAPSRSDRENFDLPQDLLLGLAALPEHQRSVLLLVGVEDLSYEQAAQVLGVRVSTVIARLHRGREGLRRTLEGRRGTDLRLIK